MFLKIKNQLSKEAESCRHALVRFFLGEKIKKKYFIETNILQKANILKEINGKYYMASLFVERWLKYNMDIEEKQPLNILPYLNDNLNIPAIVKSTIENINIIPLIFGGRLSNNSCLSKEIPGRKESIYRVEFYQSLKQTLSNFQSIQ